MVAQFTYLCAVVYISCAVYISYINFTLQFIDSHVEGSSNPGSSHNHPQLNTSEQEDKQQQKFVKELKETIEQLQTDIIVINKTSNSSKHLRDQQSSNHATTQHNLFQTFKVTFRMFSLSVQCRYDIAWRRKFT